MHRPRTLILLLACLLACTYVWPAAPVEAQTLPPTTTPVLAAVGERAFVQLRGLAVTAELDCSRTDCQIRVTQVYSLHNADRVDGVTLQLGLTGPAQGASELNDTLGPVALVDQKGTPLTPEPGSGGLAALWAVPLQRDEHRTLTLTFTQSLGSGPLLWWRLGLEALAPWGTMGGLRVELTLTDPLDEGALLQVEPGAYAFDRRQLLWNNEQWVASAPLSVQMLAPATWRRLQALRTGDDPAALARLYTELQAAGTASGIAVPDYGDEVLAAWLSAVATQPQDRSARLALASLYKERAAAQPVQYQNYMLLAGEQMAALAQIDPDDRALAEEVRALYYEAATTASRAGDPATALAYLERASTVPGAEEQTVAQLQALSLRWAVDLAEQGRVDQALLQLAGRLAPETEDAILRYAPPFVSALTEIDQTPSQRSVRQTVELYGPTAERTVERLQALAVELTQQPTYALTPVIRRDGQTVVFELVVPATSVQELQRAAATIEAVCQFDPDLVATLVAHPWIGELDLYGFEHGVLRSRAVYAEAVDSRGLQIAWTDQADYARWRLAELEEEAPADEQAQLERRLALIALRDQRFIWDQMPSSTYTVLRVVHQGSDMGPSWIIPWGQRRALADVRTVYHWSTIAMLGGMVLAVLVWLLRRLAIRAPRRQRRPS